MTSQGEASLPVQPSKNALKKAAKDKEKAEKAAKRAEQEKQQKAQADAADTAKHLYGELADGMPNEDQASESIRLQELNEDMVDQEATVRASVANARGQSAKLAFLDLRQRTENIQAVIAEGGSHNISRAMIKWIAGLSRESSVLVTGVLKKPVEPVQSATISFLELHIHRCFVISKGPEKLPLQLKDAENSLSAGDGEPPTDAAGAAVAGLSTCLDHRVISLRVPTNQAIFQISDAICALFSEFLRERGFVGLNTAKIVGAATEGGSNVFEINYFGSQAFLSQSPQFYKQMAISGGLERVFEIGPVFRAENSNTPRHLTEFTGLDFEMEIQNSWTEVVDMAEDLMLYIFRGIRQRYAYLMSVVQRALPDAGNFLIPEGRAPRLRFAEGIQMLKDAGIEAPADEDISTTNEKTLGKLVREKYGSDFYILTHYPSGARPFYTHLSPEDPSVTLSYDAFMRGQEIVSGAQRIHDPEMLVQRMKSMDPPIDPESDGFRSYIDAFRMGCRPHGGGGFGLNRIAMLWLGLQNIREATLFPRDPQRKAP